MHEIDTCFWSAWPWKNPPMGKTGLEQIYIEGLKAKCSTQETYTSESGTIETTLGRLGVPWRPPHKPCEVRCPLPCWALHPFSCVVFILMLFFTFSLSFLWTFLAFVFSLCSRLLLSRNPPPRDDAPLSSSAPHPHAKLKKEMVYPFPSTLNLPWSVPPLNKIEPTKVSTLPLLDAPSLQEHAPPQENAPLLKQ